MPLDLTGTTHGQLKVISRHSSSNKKINWNVVCLFCDKEYVSCSYSIQKNVNGCRDCAKNNIPKGSKSIYWRGGEFVSSIFLSNVKRGARKRGIESSIEIKDLDAIWKMQEGKCAYTGRELSLLGPNITASLDRIDSSKGYVAYNVQFVHKTINIMKWSLPEEEFLQFVKEIYENKNI